MERPSLDPARGAEVAKELRRLGVKGILITAAEQGYITELKCGMPTCRCPEELGGASHFDPVAEQSDWSPTHEHYPRPRREQGHRTVENSVLAHRLCNRIDFSETAGRSHERDLARIEQAREAAVEAQERFIGRKGEATYTPPPHAEGQEVPAESADEK